jgi:hypothetical protein
LIYVILRKKKDDENMLEWEDPDFTDFDFDGEDEATSEDSDSTEGGTANEEDAAGGSDSSAEK